MFLECCVPCLIVSNRDQLLKFLNQSISMHSKGQPKNWACMYLIILGLGFKYMCLGPGSQLYCYPPPCKPQKHFLLDLKEVNEETGN